MMMMYNYSISSLHKHTSISASNGNLSPTSNDARLERKKMEETFLLYSKFFLKMTGRNGQLN